MSQYPGAVNSHLLGHDPCSKKYIGCHVTVLCASIKYKNGIPNKGTFQSILRVLS